LLAGSVGFVVRRLKAPLTLLLAILLLLWSRMIPSLNHGGVRTLLGLGCACGIVGGAYYTGRFAFRERGSFGR
jgi:hypothetical protein